MQGVTITISQQAEAELRRRARRKRTDFETELAEALHAGRILTEIDEVQRENSFLSERVTFMEKSMPELEAEIRWLRTAIQQAKDDAKLMQKVILNGEKKPNVAEIRSDES
jgi:hypothetical protein